MENLVSQEDIQKIIESRHNAPHTILGPHYAEQEKKLLIRAFIPYAEQVYVLRNGTNSQHKMQKVHPDGLFEATFRQTPASFTYQLKIIDKEGHSFTRHDPYAFAPTQVTQYDRELFGQGNHYRLFDKLGAQPLSQDEVAGVNFAVWAPHVERVSVVGTFNRWDGRYHQMTLHKDSGIWEIFIPDIGENELYKFEIKTPSANVFLKTDPFAFCTEAQPSPALITYTLDERYPWDDTAWMTAKTVDSWQTPLSIYEVNLNVSDSESVSYKALAEKIITTVKDQGYTHIALSTSAYPHANLSNYYAPDARYGKPEDLMALIDNCHRSGIGVILDWIPSPFPNKALELAWFDGTRLYEHEEAEKTETVKFDFQKNQVKSFLLANAVFWIEKYHVDGLRADPETAALYLNFLQKQSDAYPKLKLLVKDYASSHTIAKEDIRKITQARHDNPHAVLGPHRVATGTLAIRALLPHAEQLYLQRTAFPEVLYQMNHVHADGLFETIIPAETAGHYRFHVTDREGNGFSLEDPYAMTASNFTENDFRLFNEGNHYHIFEKLGAHPMAQAGLHGVNFAVWAPNAQRVSVVGSFNQWDGRYHQMRRLNKGGIWEIFIPGLSEGDLYQYEIYAKNGDVFQKSDPYALYTEVPPKTACIVHGLQGKHQWHDDQWMQRRAQINVWRQPVTIYEIHFGSWIRKSDNSFYSYRELAEKLVPYVKDMGFTHIELMPIAEHPYGPSWGYQISNFYSPTARYGEPADLMAFVDICHQNGIGVILDWVPAHFPKDAHAMAWFDGTCLYEHADPKKGEHPDWGTLIFNYSRHEVENFLIANALFWLEKYHIDGLRVDAVASMLYLDYSREYDKWIPNVHGGNENLDAIEFVRHTNSIVHQKIPGVMMIAEESTSWPGVSRPTNHGGLGFGFKWNMGWMHDVLDYMKKLPSQRKHYHHNLTFSLTYAFSENFILSLSHDEVVHLKASLINKMPGDEWQQFANLRLLYTFMYAHPGKKLLFMGAEFGQRNEWNHAKGLDWELLENGPHRRLKRFVKDLNRLYLSESAFYEVDFKGVGFEWLDVNSADECVLAFMRKAKDPRHGLVFVMNFADVAYKNYRIGVPFPVAHQELFNSDAKEYGGKGGLLPTGIVMAEEVSWHGHEFSLVLTLPALSAMVLKPLPA